MNPNRWILNELLRWSSILKKLREEGKTNEQFEIMLANLTLEELIAAKLEISSKTLKSPLYGTPIWKHIRELTEDATLKFAVSVTQSPTEAAMFLGMTPYKLYSLIKKYGIYNYFMPRKKKLDGNSSTGEQNANEKESGST